MAPDDPILDTLLTERGLRPTRARRILLAHLADRHDHPSTDAILEALRAQGHRLGAATVYQNLSKLAEAGLLGRFPGPDGMMRFDPNVERHPHAVCRRCGAIADAEVPKRTLGRLKPICPHTGRTLDDWQLESVRVDFVGLCPSCRRDAPR